MNTVKQVLAELKNKSNDRTRKTLLRHGAPQNVLGVSVADLKIIAKQIKGNQQLACDLYDSGCPDAMYLAGIVADGSKMTKRQLDAWAKAASWGMISEYTVPGVACESPHARSLALKWIGSRRESVAVAGWATYSGIVAVNPDDQLDLDEVQQLLDRTVGDIDSAKNGVRYTMNGFVISVGTYVKPLLKAAKAAAEIIGAVEIDMGDTACKVPLATDYIAKIEKTGRVGKKRKTIKC